MTTTGAPASCIRRAAEAVSELLTDRLTGRPSAAATTTGRPRSSTSDRAGPPTTGLWSALSNRTVLESTPGADNTQARRSRDLLPAGRRNPAPDPPPNRSHRPPRTSVRREYVYAVLRPGQPRGPSIQSWRSPGHVKQRREACVRDTETGTP